MIDSIAKNTQDQDTHFVLRKQKDLLPLWRPEGTTYSPGIVGYVYSRFLMLLVYMRKSKILEIILLRPTKNSGFDKFLLQSYAILS